jgi:hypothetical protein
VALEAKESQESVLSNGLFYSCFVFSRVENYYLLLKMIEPKNSKKQICPGIFLNMGILSLSACP